MLNPTKIDVKMLQNRSPGMVWVAPGRLPGSFRAAPGRLQAREAILVPFKGALGASRGDSWSDLGKLLGALEEPYGDQVGPKGPSEARKKQRLQESRFERLLEP